MGQGLQKKSKDVQEKQSNIPNKARTEQNKNIPTTSKGNSNEADNAQNKDIPTISVEHVEEIITETATDVIETLDSGDPIEARDAQVLQNATGPQEPSADEDQPIQANLASSSQQDSEIKKEKENIICTVQGGDVNVKDKTGGHNSKASSSVEGKTEENADGNSDVKPSSSGIGKTNEPSQEVEPSREVVNVQNKIDEHKSMESRSSVEGKTKGNTDGNSNIKPSSSGTGSNNEFCQEVVNVQNITDEHKPTEGSTSVEEKLEGKADGKSDVKPSTSGTGRNNEPCQEVVNVKVKPDEHKSIDSSSSMQEKSEGNTEGNSDVKPSTSGIGRNNESSQEVIKVKNKTDEHKSMESSSSSSSGSSGSSGSSSSSSRVEESSEGNTDSSSDIKPSTSGIGRNIESSPQVAVQKTEAEVATDEKTRAEEDQPHTSSRASSSESLTKAPHGKTRIPWTVFHRPNRYDAFKEIVTLESAQEFLRYVRPAEHLELGGKYLILRKGLEVQMCMTSGGRWKFPVPISSTEKSIDSYWRNVVGYVIYELFQDGRYSYSQEIHGASVTREISSYDIEIYTKNKSNLEVNLFIGQMLARQVFVDMDQITYYVNDKTSSVLYVVS